MFDFKAVGRGDKVGRLWRQLVAESSRLKGIRRLPLAEVIWVLKKKGVKSSIDF
jgi:hypothetical protein